MLSSKVLLRAHWFLVGALLFLADCPLAHTGTKMRIKQLWKMNGGVQDDPGYLETIKRKEISTVEPQ